MLHELPLFYALRPRAGEVKVVYDKKQYWSRR